MAMDAKIGQFTWPVCPPSSVFHPLPVHENGFSMKKPTPYPERATLVEVGPRDGFQFEKTIIPTAEKIRIIEGLIAAGLKWIQATAFVHPQRVPQMADAETLIGQLPRHDGVTYTALALNERGVERAHAAGLTHIEISVSASDAHSRRNAGLPLSDARRRGRRMIRMAAERHMGVTAGIQCALGCACEGRIPPERVLDMAEGFLSEGIDYLSIADTTGMGNPRSAAELLEQLMPLAGDAPVGLHLHDTRGLGLANMATALRYGVTRFDASVGGMGGCPFVPGAAGNIATEDAVYLLSSMGIETGIDLARLCGCARDLSDFLGRPLPGKIHRFPETPAML